MYSNVVLGVEGHLFEELIDNYKLTKGVLLDTDLDEQFYFVSSFYNNNNIENPFYYELKPLFEFLDIKAIIRARAIMYCNQGKQIIHGSHIDFCYDHKAALLYMNTCNGFTLMCDDDWDRDNGDIKGRYEQGNKIMSVENRIAIHNGATPHCSSATSLYFLL